MTSTIPDLNSEELLWERGMTRLGEEHYERQARAYKEKGLYSLVASGRALLRDSVPRVEQELRDWFAKNESFTAVSRGYAVPWLKRLDPRVASLIACTIIVNGVHRNLSARALSYRIGSALEDEDRFSRIKSEHPDFWREVMTTTKRSKHAHRRKSAIAKASRLGWLPARWPRKAKNRAGLVLLQCFDKATGMLEFSHIRVSAKRRKLIVQPKDELLEWIAKADDRASVLSPLFLPTLEEPAEWDGPTGGGYLTDLVLRRPICRFPSEEAKKAVMRVNPEQYRPLLASLNRLQSVPWAVNEDALEVFEHLVQTGGSPLEGLAEAEIPPRPQRYMPDGETLTEEWISWRQVVGSIKDENRSRLSKRVVVQRTADVGRRLQQLGRPFYFPHRADFRGRVYPIPYWTQPQGPDVGRALLVFAHEYNQKLSEWGFNRLMIHGANLWGEKGTAEERGRWAGEFLEEWGKRVLTDPIEYSVWQEADDPFQFLAWALEAAGHYYEGTPVRLPVHVDAKNNGLQLFALMTGDRKLAELTGAIGHGQHDIYTVVAERVWHNYVWDTPSEYAQAWKRVLGGAGIPRSCTKRPVMTLPYGVTDWSSQNYVRDWYDETYGRLTGPLGARPGPACKYLSDAILAEVREVCSGAVAAMEWLQGLSDLCHERGTYLHWTAPNGWPVHQDYRQHVEQRVQTTLGDSIRNLHFRYGGGPRDRKSSRNGSAPNFVHSIDQAILTSVVPQFFPITTVHDSFGVLPNQVESLLLALRGAVAECAVKKNPLEALHREAEGYLGVQVEPPPVLGRIEPEEVMQAKELFS